MNKHDHKECPVCSAPLERTDEVIEGLVVATEATCTACGLYRDHMDGGVADERLGFYHILGTWRSKPDREKVTAERAAAIEDARSILGYTGWPQTNEDPFSHAVLADWLDDRGIAPMAAAQRRTAGLAVSG